jgi:hypothetical protein
MPAKAVGIDPWLGGVRCHANRAVRALFWMADFRGKSLFDALSVNALAQIQQSYAAAVGYTRKWVTGNLA